MIFLLCKFIERKENKMGNLGLYQVMVVLAKRVGGPLALAGWVLGTGAAVGAASMAYIKDNF